MAKEKMRDPMIGAIRQCFDRSQLEYIFKIFEAEDIQERLSILKEAMYNPEIFFSTGKIIDIEQQYETLVGAFLSRIWEKN